jgi:GAF domain-containing protein
MPWNAESREARLARAFLELADTLVQAFDLLEFLEALCAWCVDILEVDAAGVLLVDEREHELRLVAASSERMRVLEVFESQQSEGPCVDAYRTVDQVIVPDLLPSADRWPRFTPKALESGFRSAFGFPLRLRDQCIGALNLFRTEPTTLGEMDARAAQALADAAAIGILQERALREARELSEQLQHALHSRVVIEQAKGIVSNGLVVDMEEAFERLRRFSRDRNEPLRTVAERIVDGSLPPESLTRPAP